MLQRTVTNIFKIFRDRNSDSQTINESKPILNTYNDKIELVTQFLDNNEFYIMNVGDI